MPPHDLPGLPTDVPVLLDVPRAIVWPPAAGFQFELPPRFTAGRIGVHSAVGRPDRRPDRRADALVDRRTECAGCCIHVIWAGDPAAGDARRVRCSSRAGSDRAGQCTGGKCLVC